MRRDQHCLSRQAALTTTATDRGATGRDNQYGYGVVNLVAALTAPVAASPAPQTSLAPPAGSSPLAAPGAEFPVGVALTVAVAVLALALLGVLVGVFVRRRSTI
jgi:hypothetical protein